MPTVAAPPAPTGTRNVAINNASQSPGDFATLRNLTLNSNVGNFTIPPGTYGSFIANNGSGFVLGIAGATQPSVYNFSSLTLNSNSQLQVVGPVVITVGTGVTLNGAMGSPTNPAWLELKIASGGVTLNTGGVLYGNVTSPSTTGTVTINGRLEGNLTADRLTINSGAVLKIIQQGDTTPPAISVQQPVDGLVTNAAQVTVSGTYSDESQTTIVVNGTPATVQGNTFTGTVMLNEGSNNISIQATDAAGNNSQVNKNVIRDTTPPDLLATRPEYASFTTSSVLEVGGNISDATLTTVNVNGVLATINSSAFSANVPLVNGANTLHVQAQDAAGNISQVDLTVNRVDDNSPPLINLLSPTEGQIFGSNIITFLGTASDNLPISISANDTPLALNADGTFNGSLGANSGSNLIRIIAVDGVGNRSEIVRNVIVDYENPTISNLNPIDGSIITSETTSVSGHVSDQTAVSVKVNNISTPVNSAGDFTALNVPIGEGSNVITAEATDQAGNKQTLRLELTGKDRTAPPAPMLLTDGFRSRGYQQTVFPWC